MRAIDATICLVGAHAQVGMAGSRVGVCLTAAQALLRPGTQHTLYSVLVYIRQQLGEALLHS